MINNNKTDFNNINNLQENNQNLHLNFNFKSKTKRKTLQKINKIGNENSNKALKRKKTTGFEKMYSNKIFFQKKTSQNYKDVELNSLNYDEAI